MKVELYVYTSYLEYLEEAAEMYFTYTDIPMTQQDRFEAIIRMAYERRDDILNQYPDVNFSELYPEYGENLSDIIEDWVGLIIYS